MKIWKTINFRFIDEPHTKYLNQLKNNCLLKENILMHSKGLMYFKQ